jgi:multidrug transporter EmrE-like cation transporter
LNMFSPTNQGVGFFLALMATFCWGAWPSARVKCNAEAPVFVLLYLVGQLTTAVFFCLTLGMIKGNDAVFNSTGFFDVLIQGADDHKLIITLGGFCYGNSDFIFAIVCSRLSFPVGFPIYAGTELILGTLLNYAILGSSANLTLLFLGLASALCAILLMAVADLFELPSIKSDNDVNSTNNSTVYNPLDQESSKSIELETIHPAVEDSSRVNGNTKLNIWIFVCFAAGCLSGSWSPLSSLGRSGM